MAATAAAPDLGSRPVERTAHKRPFASWVKRLTNLNKSNSTSKGASSKKAKKASKKNNNPYPQSGHVNYRPESHASSTTNGYSTPPTRSSHNHGISNSSSDHTNHNANTNARTNSHSHTDSRASYTSIPESSAGNGHPIYNSSRSAAPTVATMPETIHSDAGYSRALTGTTAGGALSSIDGAGPNSTFSSPNASTHSLTTTLTTIQSTSALTPTAPGNHQPTPGGPPHHPMVQFTHQYPVTASAIPSHLQQPAQQQHQPTTYASATAHNLLTDNASILTLASSSKRRRRSMDTDASVRALAPHSVWGNSTESLPLSVFGGNDYGGPVAARSSAIGGLRDERTSVYSNQGVSAPALASERNSFYAGSHKAPARDGTDGRSVKSFAQGAQSGAGGPHEAKNNVAYDGASIRGYEGSIRSGALGRVEGVAGSSMHSPPSLLRRPSGAISLDGGVRENSILEDREGH